MRTAAAGTIGALLALWAGTGAAFWTLITVYILAMPDVGSSLIKVGGRLAGTLAGVVLSVCMVAIFPQTPGGALVFYLIAIGVGLYLSHTTPMAPYAFYLSAVTVILVATSAWVDPAAIQEIALLRFTNIAIGVIAVWLAWQFVWPVKAQDRLSEGLQERLDRADERLDGMLQALDTGSNEDLARLSPGQSLLAAQIALLQSAAAESGEIDRHRSAWLGAITLVDRFASQVAALEGQMRPAELAAIPDETRSVLRRATEFVRSNWALAHEAIRTRTALERPTPHPDALIEALERAQASRSLDAHQTALVATMLVLVRHVPQAHELVQWIATGHEQPSLQVDMQGTRAGGGVLSGLRRLDTNALKATVKAVVASGICMLLGAAFHWPDAGSVAVVTTVLIIQPTIGASLAKSRQRIAGALIGAVVGLMLLAIVVPNTDDLAGMLGLIFVVSLMTGWLMAGPWDTSYGGLQFGMVMVMVFLGTDMASTSLTPAFDRIWCILLGLLVGGIVLRLLWPVRAGDQLLVSLAKCLRTMADTLDSGLRDPVEEERLRPMYGWRYRMAWLLADAYRFREEARFEHGIGFDAGMPSLELGVSLQDAMLRSLLIVRNRVEHPEWVEVMSRHPQAHELRRATQRAMLGVADVLEGKPGETTDLEGLLERVRPRIIADAAGRAEDRSALDTHLGYFEQLIRAVEPMHAQAIEVRAMFATKG